MSEINSIPMPTRKGFKDLTGQVFTRLTVTGYAGKHGHNHKWYCVCECGSELDVQQFNLESGNSKSCGCLRTELNTKHGMSKRGHPVPGGAKRPVLPEYRAWTNMWARTTNPNHPGYALYAGRRPPDVWRDFSAFMADVGARPSEHLSLDRIDNDKPYGPGNCRWTTNKVQSNNMSVNVLITKGGETLTVAQWADRLGVSTNTLRTRLKRGWSADRALTEAVNTK